MTRLCWAFLDRHEAGLAASPRTALMVRSLTRLGDDARAALRDHAAQWQERIDTV